MGIFINDQEEDFDVSIASNNDLQSLINSETEKEKTTRQHKVPVSAELRKARILKNEINRVQSRVLFVTTDTSILETQSAATQSLNDLGEEFDEVHILLLLQANKAPKEPVRRISRNVWLYTAHHRFMLPLAWEAKKVAEEQLVFTNGFRPDIIVAREPFEAAFTGWLLAKKYQRPLQVHISHELYVDKELFLDIQANNKWRWRMMNFVLKRVESVRTSTSYISTKLSKRFPKISDVAQLPRHYNISQMLSLPSVAQSKFEQFKFTLLYIGKLDADSTFHQALDAARSLLRTPSIGLAVIGSGPRKDHYIERAKILKIDTQVVWLGDVEDKTPYIQSANLLMLTDVHERSDAIAIKAAALGLPMVCTKTTLRSDLFTNGRDAFLVEEGDIKSLAESITKFINANSLRTQFRENAREVVKQRIDEDPVVYRQALRNSIEQVLYSKEESIENSANALIIKKAQHEAEIKSKQYTTVDGLEMKLPKAAATEE